MNQPNQNVFATTRNCPHCGRCFCSTTKLQAIDGTPTCFNCKANYETRLSNGIRQPNSLNKPH